MITLKLDKYKDKIIKFFSLFKSIRGNIFSSYDKKKFLKEDLLFLMDVEECLKIKYKNKEDIFLEKIDNDKYVVLLDMELYLTYLELHYELGWLLKKCKDCLAVSDYDGFEKYLLELIDKKYYYDLCKNNMYMSKNYR